MTLRKTILVIITLAFAAAFASAQTAETKPAEPGDTPEWVKASPAFAEVVFRKAVVEAELEEMLVRYTEQYPKVIEKRFEMSELDKEQDDLVKTPEAEASKLTLALGKMLVQRAAYATELGMLKLKYDDTHPDVKKAKRKLEIFDKAIKRIL